MMKRLFFFLSLFALLISGYANAGEEKSAVIRADQITYDKKEVIARGNVVFTYQDTVIKTCCLVYNPGTGLIHSEGEVTMERAGEEMKGKSLVYNVKKRSGAVYGVTGQTRNIYVQGQQIKGELFYTGQAIEFTSKSYEIKHSSTTTCDYPEGKQHYHITAEDIQIYPGDKMIISHGRLWLGKLALWHVAKLVIDLHPRVYHRQSYFPHFGYNKIDGVFIKTATNYLANKNNTGTFLFDYYQRTGFAAGIEEQFPIGKRGSGTVNLYHQNGSGFQHFTREEDSSTLQYDFGAGTHAAVNFNLFRFKVPPINSPDNITTSASLTRQSKNYSWSLTESSNSTSGFTNSQNVQYHRLQDLGGDLHLDLTENFFKSTQGGITNSTLHNLTALTKQLKDWTINLYYEKTDSALFQGGFIDRTPEINIHSDNLTLEPLKLPYQVSWTLSDYFESFKNVNAWRSDFQFLIPQHTYDFGKSFHVTTSALYQQDFYDTGNLYATRNLHARYLLGDQTQVAASLADHFDAIIDYRSQSNIGFDPLVFDIVPPFRTLSAEFSLHHKDLWRIDVGSAYDYKNKFYQQFIARVDLHPRKDWYFHFDGFYDPNYKKWENLIAQADFWPLHDVRLQYWADFNLPTGQVSYQDIALYKEWHDWEARVIYRWHQQEVFVFFNLKAFPAQQIQLGINPIMNVNSAIAAPYIVP